MARQIILDFEPDPDDPSFTKVWHFAEELYTVLRDDGWASIPVEEVNRTTRQLKVTVHSKRRVRRILSTIEELLEKHYIKSRSRITVITPAE